jgi:hypothetical protein
VGPSDSGARWAAAGCGRARQRGAALIRGTQLAAGEGGENRGAGCAWADPEKERRGPSSDEQ